MARCCFEPPAHAPFSLLHLLYDLWPFYEKSRLGKPAGLRDIKYMVKINTHTHHSQHFIRQYKARDEAGNTASEADNTENDSQLIWVTLWFMGTPYFETKYICSCNYFGHAHNYTWPFILDVDFIGSTNSLHNTQVSLCQCQQIELVLDKQNIWILCNGRKWEYKS